MKLGRRMAAIAAMVPAGSKVADIGTDHAYLPIYLVTEGTAPSAVAGDVHKGPYQSALSAVESLGLSDKIAVRFGDGLNVISPGEVDTVIIAGMGGPNIIDILAGRTEITRLLSRLVLQPMLAAGAVRRWLADNGWRIVAEALVEEDSRLYEIIAAERGNMAVDDPILYDIGPLLWRQGHPLLKAQLAAIIAQLRRVTLQMGNSQEALNSSKYREYMDKIALLEEKYSWL